MDINSDHQPDLVVASNNQPLQTFINQGRGASPLLVKVRGKPGNLRGAGSRLQVIRKNGTSEVIDLNLGVGYLTGNEPQAWVSQRADNQVEHLVLTDAMGRQHKLSPSPMAKIVTFDLAIKK